MIFAHKNLIYLTFSNTSSLVDNKINTFEKFQINLTISFKDIFLGRHLSEIIAFNEEEKIKKEETEEEEFWSLSTKLQSSGFLWKGYRSSLLSLVIERALSFKTHVDSYQSLASTMSILQMKLQAKYHRKNTTTSIYTIKSTYLLSTYYHLVIKGMIASIIIIFLFW